MANANTHHPYDGPHDLTSRLVNLHVDDRFPLPPSHLNQGPPSHGPQHPSPNPTGFTPSLSAPNRFSYPGMDHPQMEVYNFYQPPNAPLDPPFSPQIPTGAFGYAPPTPGDLMQNQFEYGQADPYGAAAASGVNHGLGLGMEGVSMSLRGQGAQAQVFRPRDGLGQRSPTKTSFRSGGGARDGQHQGGRKASAPDGGMISPTQGFGGYGQGYWPIHNGTFVERGKKPQVETPRAPHTILRPHASFTQYPPHPAPLYPAPNAVRNPYLGHFTPNTPSLHQIPLTHYGPQYTAPLLRYQGSRPRRFDDLPRSALLEDYRLNKTDKNWGLAEIFGHIIEFSGDQHGSRLIQTKLEHATDQDRQTMYLEILPNALTLMTDVFGNYVIQKFFDFGSEEEVSGLAEKMRGQVYDLSMQMYGCRVVQKALDKVSENQKLSIISELDGKIVDCVKSANANHVIQRIIQSSPPKSVPDAFLGHALDLSIHSFGCRVLQKAVENLPDEHKRDLLEELQGCTRQLIEDAFGNYVVQSMIIAAGPDHRSRVIKIIRGQVWTLSRHKFASNVVEKAIIHANANDKRELVYELVNVREDGSHRVHAILRDAYSNFVLQTCLKHAEHPQRQQLLDLIVPLMNTIRHTPPGKRLDQLISEMQSEGFTVSLVAPSHETTPDSSTLVNPDSSSGSIEFKLPLNPLHAHRPPSRARSDITETDEPIPGLEVEEASTDLSGSRSGSSGANRGLISPDVKPLLGARGDGKKLRPTASAPPRSDRPIEGRAGKMVLGRTGSPMGMGEKKEELIDLLR